MKRSPIIVGDLMEPLVRHSRQRGEMVRVQEYVAAEVGHRFHLNMVRRWLSRDLSKRVQPRFDVGLVLLRYTADRIGGRSDFGPTDWIGVFAEVNRLIAQATVWDCPRSKAAQTRSTD